jgi:hypothetical protein
MTILAMTICGDMASGATNSDKTTFDEKTSDVMIHDVIT